MSNVWGIRSSIKKIKTEKGSVNWNEKYKARTSLSSGTGIHRFTVFSVPQLLCLSKVAQEICLLIPFWTKLCNFDRLSGLINKISMTMIMDYQHVIIKRLISAQLQ